MKTASVLLVLVLALASLAHVGLVTKSAAAVSRVSSITLQSGENNLASAVIDATGQYVYFGTCSGPPYTNLGKVVKIRVGVVGFGLSLSNSGGITVAQGSSSSNTITVTLLSGTIQTVSLTASGLPSGASASFSPSSGNPTFTSTCTISTSSSTPAGSYTITVTGTLGDLSGTTTFTLAVNPPFGQTITTIFTDTSYTLDFMMTGNIYDDSGMLGIYTHRSPPKILFPKTDMSRVLSTGQPTWSGYTHLVTVGGRNANPTTRYFEDNGLAPLKCEWNSTHLRIIRGSEVKLNVPFSSLGSTNDYFTMQIIVDGTHKVVTLWGITQYGTFASGVYFDGIYPNLTTLAQGWYIIRWQDLNGNGIPDYPTEFTIHASGN